MLIVIVSVLGACLAEDIGSCSFSRDCESYDYCQTIQDAGCVCNFGQCVITGNTFFRGSECEQYTDCACKNNPEACFCEDGFCRETRWECHENGDCAKLSKCDGLSCTCSGKLCEFDCVVDDDCKDFHCNQALGYICKCENSLCTYKEKPTECKQISDCVDQGTCLASQPCACTQEYCTLPWWVQDRDQHNNCRSDQDCEETILSCGGGKCSCLDMAPINDWESRGTCGVSYIVDQPAQGTTKSGENSKQAEKTKNSENDNMKSEDDNMKSEDKIPPVKNQNPDDDKIIFPEGNPVQTEDLEAFGIHKLGY